MVDLSGTVLVLGEVKKEAAELDRLERQLPEFAEVDPGPPVTGSNRKAAQKLAHRLWITRAPWLWLAGPSDRRPYRVTYASLQLERMPALPTPVELHLDEAVLGDVPRLRLPPL